jgi:dTDP-4-dehydrorhamnose reductase
MRLLVTGHEGQVARSLVERGAARPGVEVVAVGRPELDLLDPASIERAIGRHRPDVVVSAAAYTAVDQAEDEPDLAFAVNAAGAGAVAAAAALEGLPVIHLSTDYVFSGDKGGPYAEEDEPAPLGVYGRSKLEGERLVAAANPRHVILRTAWVYSPFGRNFVKTMLRLAAERDEVAVVSDQWGNPTSALDIADGILHISSIIRTGRGYGLYHLAGTSEATWADFAERIFAVARDLGAPTAGVRRIPTSAYPTRARRPISSTLNCTALARDLDWRAPDWQKSVSVVIARMLGESS